MTNNKIMQKKILILGSKGNLGQQLVKIFTAASSGPSSHEVIAWDREEIDITDKALITKKINDIKPDIIINAAAYNAVDKCEEDERAYEVAKKLNGEAVGYLAEAALATEALIVHYSSDYIFSGNKKAGYREDDKPEPVNKYAETKLLGEKELISRSGQGLKWYLIRTSKLFGPQGASEAAKLNFFDLILKSSKEKKSINVVNEEVSCFTYSPDLAKATKGLIESEKGHGIYHITNSGSCTWYEAVGELFRIADVKTRINPVKASKFPRPAKRPKYSVLLNTKFEQLRSWKEALREYLDKRHLDN